MEKLNAPAILVVDMLNDFVTKIEESQEMINVKHFFLKEIVDSVLNEFAEKISSRGVNGSSPGLMTFVFT